MLTLVLAVYLCSLPYVSFGVIIRKGNKTVVCHDLPEDVLSQILGPAYNSRYMSIDRPVEDNFEVDGGYKRRADIVPSFYVDDSYSREIADEPAWIVDHVRVPPRAVTDRRKRSAKGARQWECESRINWIDLGLDYFPRYLRSVECTSKTCWYGHYKCKPRSFTVKILRRKVGRCIVAKANAKVGIEGLPDDLRQLWVWEERAVNFCCDCAV